jgi:hypothetical protein
MGGQQLGDRLVMAKDENGHDVSDQVIEVSIPFSNDFMDQKC